MTEPVSSSAVMPVVVAVNAARRCAVTLELATALASNAGADLEVVFVEDADLLRLADLPVTIEIDRISAMTRELDAGRMLRAMRCEVQHLRRELTRLGKRTSVHASVTVVRGHYLTEALAASARGEVTFVHGARRPVPGDSSPTKPLAARSSAALRAKRPGAGISLWAFFDGSPASVRALQVAVVLARSIPGHLTVLAPDAGSGELEERQREAQIATGRTDMQVLTVAGNWPSQIERLLAHRADSLLVLARESVLSESSDARAYLESLSVPVVLVA